MQSNFKHMILLMITAYCCMQMLLLLTIASSPINWIRVLAIKITLSLFLIFNGGAAYTHLCIEQRLALTSLVNKCFQKKPNIWLQKCQNLALFWLKLLALKSTITLSETCLHRNFEPRLYRVFHLKTWYFKAIYLMVGSSEKLYFWTKIGLKSGSFLC